jgi:hypothetical protein
MSEPVAYVRSIFTDVGIGHNETVLERAVITIQAPSGEPYEFRRDSEGDKRLSEWIEVSEKSDARWFNQQPQFTVKKANPRWSE